MKKYWKIGENAGKVYEKNAEKIMEESGKFVSLKTWEPRMHWRIHGDPILSFSHTFLPKSARIGGRPTPPPLNGKSRIRHCMYGQLRLSCVLLANYVPKCQMSSSPYGPILTTRLVCKANNVGSIFADIY